MKSRTATGSISRRRRSRVEAVNAGEKAAVADVLDVGVAEVSGEDEAAYLQLHQAASDVLGAQAATACQFLGSGRPANLGVSAEQEAASFFAVGHLDGCTGRGAPGWELRRPRRGRA